MAGLDALANLRRVLAEDYADVFPQEDRQALNAAIGRRETAVGEKVADLMIADIDAATDGMPAFNTLVTQTNPQLLQRLPAARSEEPTSELQSLLRIPYAVLCSNKNKLPTYKT